MVVSVHHDLGAFLGMATRRRGRCGRCRRIGWTPMVQQGMEPNHVLVPNAMKGYTVSGTMIQADLRIDLEFGEPIIFVLGAIGGSPVEQEIGWSGIVAFAPVRIFGVVGEDTQSRQGPSDVYIFGRALYVGKGIGQSVDDQGFEGGSVEGIAGSAVMKDSGGWVAMNVMAIAQIQGRLMGGVGVSRALNFVTG